LDWGFEAVFNSALLLSGWEGVVLVLVLVLAPVGWPAFRNFSQVGVVGESCLCFSERYGTVRLEVVYRRLFWNCDTTACN